MIVAGVDVGSLTAKVVLLCDGRMIGHSLLPTGANSRAAAERAMEQALAGAGLALADVGRVVATGYGRISVPFAAQAVTEITCHGRGARALLPAVRTVIDIGGQDSKAIRLDDQGRVVDFAMNDKCAAGTGRFLEVMAAALETDLGGMVEAARHATQAVPISSVCTVFAESEVVSLVAAGRPKGEIIRGLFEAVADKVEVLAGRVGLEPPLAMTGGVAQNAGVVAAISRRLGVELLLPPEPQLVGAYGAALIAGEQAAKSA